MVAKKKALQIGAGMVGRCIVHDMISDFDFVVHSFSPPLSGFNSSLGGESELILCKI